MHALARHAGGEQHEGELAALGDGQAEAPRRSRLQSPPTAEHVEDAIFTATRPTTMATSAAASSAITLRSMRHADGDEEHARAAAPRKARCRPDLVAIFRIGEQHAGNEGAERGRQAGRSISSVMPTTVSSALAVIASVTPVAGDQAIEPDEQKAPAGNDGKDGADGLQAGRRHIRRRGFLATENSGDSAMSGIATRS